MDLFFLQLAILFLPGLIWERIDANYGQKRTPAQFDVIRRAFVYGLTSYVATYGAYRAADWPFDVITPEKDKTFLGPSIFDEIVISSCIAFALGVIWLYITKYKLVTKLLQKIKATKRYGDEDVWDFTFNSDNKAVQYVHLRDFDKEIVYAGFVEVFSETDRVRELVLRNVQVYNFAGDLLFETPRVYVARAMDKIDIEFPYREEPREGDDP